MLSPLRTRRELTMARTPLLRALRGLARDLVLAAVLVAAAIGVSIAKIATAHAGANTTPGPGRGRIAGDEVMWDGGRSVRRLAPAACGQTAIKGIPEDSPRRGTVTA